MVPTDSGYLGRPNKRARGSSSLPGPSPDSPPPSISPVHTAGSDQAMSNNSQPLNSSTGPNLALGPVARVRGEDRSRKLSCKECRRLKLKCDRVFPCQSCVKRGCGSLCPEGALTAGRGSRFILANTETLHDKIAELSDRVRQLEEALEQVQKQCSNQPHPLLAPELLRVKTSQELYGTTPFPHPPPLTSDIPSPTATPSQQQRDDHTLPESVVTLSLGQYATAATTMAVGAGGKPAGTKGNNSSSSTSFVARRETTPPEVPPDILQLSSTFPFPWMVDLSIRKRIRDALPPREEAELICAEARNNALWQFNMDTVETFLPNLLNYCYTTPITDLSPRRLALLLMVLSIGSLVDLKRPLGSLHGEAYHHLARASVCEIPLMEEPDFDVLHALFFMIYYHLIFSDNKKAVGYAWNLMGFVAKLAQGLGLHRDGARSSKTIPEEHERRRAIFWELLNMDCRMSLSLGRPPSISLVHVDAKRPSYVGAGIYVSREEIVYHDWKNDFFIECLSPILEAMTNTAHPPDYTHILGLDRSVRDFAVPSLLEEQNTKATPRFLVMQRGLVVMGREIALLQLHRRYFMQAMNSTEPFDMNHEFAPSVLATYLSASTLIATVEGLYEREQNLSVRFLHFWFNVFSAAVMLSLFISRAPTTPLATFALQDLERICQLFHRAASILPFCAKVLPHIQKLAEKGRLTLRQSATSASLTATGNPYPVTLPPSFAKAHPLLSDQAERMGLDAPVVRPRGAGPPSSASTSSSHTGHTRSTSPVSSATIRTSGGLVESLPNIYHFSSMVNSVDEKYSLPPLATSVNTTRRQPQNLFVPSSPRIGEDEKFNFDHGALMSELEETSYMAWF
ncbi:hypothetical protein D9756_004646 [Leucocoprinus leucothites]|uniref:Zn(2)-C6 fungal-type domain-containing protein n=1 Tax=Leucocoprinus leucothites TaxID=201217 RepID=A0A8H5LKQ3_9AGAR|nr:hypothetical protein D9756_004646 [Leucoagaricus leucothites]